MLFYKHSSTAKPDSEEELQKMAESFNHLQSLAPLIAESLNNLEIQRMDGLPAADTDEIDPPPIYEQLSERLDTSQPLNDLIEPSMVEGLPRIYSISRLTRLIVLFAQLYQRLEMVSFSLIFSSFYFVMLIWVFINLIFMDYLSLHVDIPKQHYLYYFMRLTLTLVLEIIR